MTNDLQDTIEANLVLQRTVNDQARRLVEAEQLLAAALKELADDLALRNGYLVQANEVGRATVIAQVKALIDTDFLHVEILDGAVDSAMALLKCQLDALQPDPSLAVLSTSEREQALEKVIQGAREGYAEHDSTPETVARSESWFAEARRLLHLPPTEEQP